MPLPSLIEVVPFDASQLQSFLIDGKSQIVIPGSKSITNRAIVLAALSNAEVTLKGALWSEDTEAMTDCMHRLGVKVVVAPDPDVAANRLITVQGCGGNIPNGGTEDQPLELFVANAGTAARFLTAMVCLGKGVYRLSGVPRMHERPQKELIRALRSLGYRIDTPNDMLPAVVHGTGPRPGNVVVSVDDSSQFASALLLSSRAGQWTVATPPDANPDELPYVEMTRRMTETFPHTGGQFQIEPDASSASYFHAVNAIFPDVCPVEVVACQPPRTAGGTGWQIDAEFPRHAPTALRASAPSAYVKVGLSLGSLYVLVAYIVELVFKWLAMGSVPAAGPSTGGGEVHVSRKTELGDSVMTAITIAPLAARPYAFDKLGVLRKQECERVQALRTELTKCAANVTETGDTLALVPCNRYALGRATIHTYHDHRMAMCFATLGLACPGIKLQDPSCVRKTVPSFFQILAAPPPAGLGVEIWECDPETGARVRRLTDPADLIAAKK